MLNVSNAFNEAFKSDLREVKMRIKINDVTYTDEDIVSFNFNAGSIVGESFAIGSTYANSIKLTLCKIVEGLKQLDEVTPEMGIVLPNGSTEWVKLGTFIISEEVNPDRNENRTSLECTDKMIMLDDIYESELNYPAKIIDVALEIANLAGVEVDKVSFGRLMENTIQKPIGYTFRQAIGLIAQFEAGYACFDRNGLLAIRQLEDKDYQVTPNEYFQNGLTKNELKFRPAGIQVKVSDTSEDDKVLKIGNEKGSVIRLENKVMTEQLLRLVYEKVKDINYYPYSLKWRGNPAVEVGDWLLVNDTRGNMFKVPNLSYSMEYKGGLTATSTVETVASNEVRFGYKKILDQVVELVENSIKDLDGNVIYYGVEEPPNPKEGDTWFKYVDSDTEIWVYEKVEEPDVFDWVFKISSAVDESIKEAIDDLEQKSKEQQENIDKALLDAEKARDEAGKARQEAFDSATIARQAELDALNALTLGDGNRTEITRIDGEQKLINTKVEGNTTNILKLQTDSEKLSLSIGKVQADVDGINGAQLNLITDYPNNEVQLIDINGYYWEYPFTERNSKIKVKPDTQYIIQWDYDYISGDSPNQMFTSIGYSNENSDYSVDISGARGSVVTSQKFVVITTENEDYHKKYPYLAIRFSITDTPRPSKMNYHSITVREGNLKGPWSPPINAFTSKTEFSSFEATMQGFQSTVNSEITGLQSQQTQMSGQISSTVNLLNSIGSDNLILESGDLDTTTTLIHWNKWAIDNKVEIGIESVKEYKSGSGVLFMENASASASAMISNRFKVNSIADYTFSFITRSDENTSKIWVAANYYLNDGSVLQQQIINKVEPTLYFNKMHSTFKTPLDVEEMSIEVVNLGKYPPNKSKTYFIEVMLVEGKAATGYAPSSKEHASKSEVIQLSDQITQTVNKVETIDGTVTKQQGQIAILSDNISLKVDKDNAIAQINLSPEKIRLDAKFIHLSGKTLIDDAVIKTAHLENLAVTGAKIQDATISTAKIISLDADKINASTLSSITSNTGQLNVTGWLDFTTDNRGLRGTYDFGDPYNNAFNYRWFDGTFRLSHRHLVYGGYIHDVNPDNTKGVRRGSAETYYGLDYIKLRSWGPQNNMLGQVDISSQYFRMSTGFNDPVGILFNPGGGSYFGASMVVNGDVALRGDTAIKAYTLQARDLADNVYINQGRPDLADFRVGRDGSNLNSGRVVQSLAIYNRTYSGPANMIVHDTGIIGRTTSARKYKLEIETASSVIANAKKVLSLNPKSWFDKGEVLDGVANKRYFGFIADEFDESGLNEVVIYNECGEVESLAYDRISMYHNVILTDHEKEIKMLNRKIETLEERLYARKI